MGLVYDPVYLEHETGAHVESPRRLVETVDLLKREGILDKVRRIQAREAEEEELQTVHAKEHIRRVREFASRGGGWLDPDTVTSPGSYRAAAFAVGGLLEAVRAVLEGEIESAFALVRPPGHHATRNRAMGFCLFNNVAVAAKYALGKGAERVFIVDFDVHHGNGTQEAFYSDPEIFYFSTHQYPYYPGTGSVDEIGHGPGRGTTANIPLPAGCGDPEYLKIYEEVLPPLVRRFSPDLILVSAGFDPHWADPLAGMRVSVGGFRRIAEVIRDLAREVCGGRVVFTLEGGYHLQAVSYSVKAVLEALMDLPAQKDPLGPARYGGRPPGFEPMIEAVIKLHGI